MVYDLKAPGTNWFIQDNEIIMNAKFKSLNRILLNVEKWTPSKACEL
jgi:hypothetical protein